MIARIDSPPRRRTSGSSASSLAVLAVVTTAFLLGSAGPGAWAAGAYSPTAPPPPSLFVDNLRRHRTRGAGARRATTTTKTATVGRKPFVVSTGEKLLTRFDAGGGGGVRPSLTVLRGGASSSSSSSEPATNGSNNAFLRSVSSFWACFGVVGILAKSIGRIVPIALEPFSSSAPSPLTNFQLGAYVLTCAWFAYVEGYKGFQLKFSPLVVSRSRTLYAGERHTPFHHVLLGPFYAMGLFHATKKRVITSWSVTLGVAAIVGLVKRMPYPWRNVVDAGVVVGLTWGTISIVVGYVRALVTGEDHPIDPALPKEK